MPLLALVPGLLQPDNECGAAEEEVTESDVYKNWNKLQPQERSTQ